MCIDNCIDRAHTADMTQTGTLTATAALGKCVRCDTTYRASNWQGTYRGYCTEATCQIDGWRPAIKWSRLKATTTATECNDECRSAKGNKCACSCAGEHHGSSWGLAF